VRKTLARIAFPAALAATAYLGSQPAAAEELVYVPLGSAGEVLVIDAATDAIVGRIPDVPDSHGLAATPDGRFLIAGSFAETTPGESEIPPKPAGMAESEHQAHHRKPGAAIGETPETISFLSIIRAQDGSLMRRIEVPGAVHHVAVTPDGRYAVATHPNGGSISVVDLRSFKLSAVVPTGPLPNYAAISPDGKRIYVSNAGDGTVSEIDAETWVVSQIIVVWEDPEHMVLSGDGQRLYLANADGGTVLEITLENGLISRRFEIGGLLHGLDLSEDGRNLYVSAREQGKLVAIALDTGEARSAPLGPEPYHLTRIGGSGKLYVSSAEEPKIWVVDQDSLSVLNEVPVPGKAHQMAVVRR
jgi:YVTN family beta-propeller protein